MSIGLRGVRPLRAWHGTGPSDGNGRWSGGTSGLRAPPQKPLTARGRASSGTATVSNRHGRVAPTGGDGTALRRRQPAPPPAGGGDAATVAAAEMSDGGNRRSGGRAGDRCGSGGAGCGGGCSGGLGASVAGPRRGVARRVGGARRAAAAYARCRPLNPLCPGRDGVDCICAPATASGTRAAARRPRPHPCGRRQNAAAATPTARSPPGNIRMGTRWGGGAAGGVAPLPWRGPEGDDPPPLQTKGVRVSRLTARFVLRRTVLGLAFCAQPQGGGAACGATRHRRRCCCAAAAASLSPANSTPRRSPCRGGLAAVGHCAWGSPMSTLGWRR